MELAALIEDFSKRGIKLTSKDGRLIVEPASKLSDTDREIIRSAKLDLLRVLASATRSGETANPNQDLPPAEGIRTNWRQNLTPNSRLPLIPLGVHAILESIEHEARVKGWPPELLWNSEFWGSPRGLAAVLDEGDAIAEVTSDYIAILKTERHILRFQRRAS
jgi:hypothetical protein